MELRRIQMKNSLYKKRLALLLAVVLSFHSIIPVSASSLSGKFV